MRNIKKTYLLLLIVIGLVLAATYSTYALFTSSLEIGDISLDTELKYTFKINSNQEFTIGANSKLRFNAIVENDMEGTISYGVYYKMISPIEITDNITIAEVTDTSTLTTSGPIDVGIENGVTVPLVIINNTNDEIKVQIGVRTGYYTDAMQPSDIIYEEGEVLITDIIDSENAGSYQCEASSKGECIEECYSAKEDGYKNTYCDVTCTTKTTELSNSNLINNLDTSGANEPELTNGLVPVMHNGTTWVTADRFNENSTYKWYDYNNKIWANAVLLTDVKRNSLTKDKNYNYTPGQTIGDTETDGVLAFYVWIPRYKYKVWNINKIIGTDSYSAQTNGIDVEFIGKDEEGTITCTYSFAAPSSTAGSPNETCTGANGNYYTHPAFKFGNDNLTGIWVGKFELSSSIPSTDNGGGETTYLTPRILPNINPWLNNGATNFWKVIKDMQIVGNDYGLTTDITIVDTHMLTNMEWGAVAYLTNSKYGRCTGSTCTETALNSYKPSFGTNLTGCGPQSSESTSSGSTCNAYTSTLGLTASTTGNIYGAYDMSGGVREYVMGNASTKSGSYNYSNYGGFVFTYSGNEKYITTYAYGTSESDQTAYNRGRLGDATSETGGWYSDRARFLLGSSGNRWLTRSDFYSQGTKTGVFAFEFASGGTGNSASTRGALVVFPK